jgi:histidyl-tRNA synthetase
MKRADRLDARVTLIVGGDELARGEVTLRDMRGSEQRAIPRADAVRAVRAILEGQ